MIDLAGKQFKARDRTVNKMTREGLTEENLGDGSVQKIGNSKEDVPHIRISDDRLVPNRADRSREIEEADEKTGPGTKKGNRRKQKEYGKRGGLSNRAAPFDEEKLPARKPGEAASDAEEGTEEAGYSNHSARMRQFRGKKLSGKAYTGDAVDASRGRKKKLVQEYSRNEQVKTDARTVADFRDDVEKKAKRERLQQEQKKKKQRLSFDDEGGMAGPAAGWAGLAAKTALHGKVHEAEEDNSSVEAAHKSELFIEDSARKLRDAQKRQRKRGGYAAKLKEKEGLNEKSGRLQFGLSGTEKNRGTGAGKDAVEAASAKKARVRRFWQKKRYKDEYAAVRSGHKAKTEAVRATESVAVKAKRMVQEVVRKNKTILIMAAVMALVFLLIAVSLGSCAAAIQGSGTTIISTTYAADDSDIYAVENAYAAMEAALNEQINNMEQAHPGHDEYQYQIDEISHNPYHLISYFTVKYGGFTYAQVAAELEQIFREQYTLNTESRQETVTETRTVRVGESLGTVVTSGYCNCPLCCGIWSGGPTASGAMPQANHTIAVDASNPFVPMGTHIIMNGVEYVVEDTGNFARYGVQFDVYYGSHLEASAHGHKTWEAYIADSNGSQEVEVTSTRTVNQFNTALTNHSLDAVLRSRMNEEEEERYDQYNLTYGNRDYLFDTSTVSSYGSGGFGYEIPAEALSDAKFAKMIREAEKYLGYPYVWGGASPSTSFDCSGFVCWVINNCGNGWNVGRTSADGLRSACAYVSPSEAKPGDLIFFQGTYNTSGASHVGIYVGNGMMIHCGSPIQYTSINTSYWQQHFMAFGRLS